MGDGEVDPAGEVDGLREEVVLFHDELWHQNQPRIHARALIAAALAIVVKASTTDAPQPLRPSVKVSEIGVRSSWGYANSLRNMTRQLRK